MRSYELPIYSHQYFKVNVQIQLKPVRDSPFSDAVDTAEHDQRDFRERESTDNEHTANVTLPILISCLCDGGGGDIYLEWRLYLLLNACVK